ncbi:MAG: hypothetical protein R2873_06150 [Caldilineaceae bacterium]
MDSIRVAIIDSSEFYRFALRSFLTLGATEVVVVSEFTQTSDALALLEDPNLDILLCGADVVSSVINPFVW